MRTKRARKSRGLIILKFSFFLYLIGGVFLVIWLRTAIVNIEYEIGELNTKKVALLREERLLMAKRSSFYSARMIEDMATKRLGMSEPNRENIFHVKAVTSASVYKASMPSRMGNLKERLIWKGQQ
ncbi:MAG: hypothetical protein Fur0020_10950 [Thermodesulfovibrionia bacterium]